MDDNDIRLLASAVAEAVAAALKNITIELDGQALGYAAATAINENRARDGRASLEL